MVKTTREREREREKGRWEKVKRQGIVRDTFI
jgi:hypothetical protein